MLILSWLERCWDEGRRVEPHSAEYLRLTPASLARLQAEQGCDQYGVPLAQRVRRGGAAGWPDCGCWVGAAAAVCWLAQALLCAAAGVHRLVLWGRCQPPPTWPAKQVCEADLAVFLRRMPSAAQLLAAGELNAWQQPLELPPGSSGGEEEEDAAVLMEVHGVRGQLPSLTRHRRPECLRMPARYARLPVTAP